MRFLETLLLLANLLTFFVLAIPLPGMQWMRYSALITLMLAGAQVLVEGLRWQMVPAYALAGLFFSIWRLQNVGWGAALGGYRWINGLVVLALAVSIALPMILPVFRFPDPTGPYAIGTITYHWVDADRPEVFTADPNDRRELMVQVWYPARANATGPRAHWVEDGSILAPMARLLHLPGFVFQHFQYVTTDGIVSAPLSDTEPSYPVLLFSHGRAGFRNHNTAQVEELVSHGYIVATIDHPYAAAGVLFPNERLAEFDSRMFDSEHVGHPPFFDEIIDFLGQDAVFTLDQLTALNQADPNGILTGRLDLEHAGMFGPSLGGAITAEACRLDQRLKACLVMDMFIPADVLQSGLQQPVMLMGRDAKWMHMEHWAQADIDEEQTTLRALFGSLPGDAYFLRIDGIFHNDFTDAALISPLTQQTGFTGPIGGKRARTIINAYSLAFFDRYLKGRPASLLDGPAEQYPEVIFETRRH